MNSFSLLLEKLHEWFGDQPFSIWFQFSRDRHFRLVFSSFHENAATNSPPMTVPCCDVDTSHMRYTFESLPAQQMYRFFYENEGQAVICLAHKANQPIILTTDQSELLWFGIRLLLAEEKMTAKAEESKKLFEGIRSISATLDVHQIIRGIIGNALAVIPAADAGLLHLYDPTINRLIPKATVGFQDTVFKDLKMRVGESIAGKVFEDGVPRMYKTSQDTTHAMKDISADNFHSLNHAKALRDLNGLLCVPISRDEKRIGVLVLHQFHQENVFTEYDLDLLQGFADQTSIALQNAELYAEVKQAYEQLAAISAQLQAKHDDLIQRNHIHESIKQLSLQNKGAETIVKTLNKMTGHSIYFADWLEQKMYPEKSAVFFSWDELYTLLNKRRQPISVNLFSPASGVDQLFCLYPLINGSIFLGCLIIPLDKRGLSDLARMTVEQGSAVLILDLVKKQSISSVLYKRAHDLFQELLASKGNELFDRARSMGLQPQAKYYVIYAHLTQCHDLALLEANIHRLITRWKWEFSKTQMLVYGFHNHVTLLIQSLGSRDGKDIRERLQQASDEWELGKEASLSIGVGSMASGIEQISKSYEEAKKAAHYLTNRGRSGVVYYKDLGVNRLMLNQSQADIDAFIQDVFAPFWQDPEKYQEWEQTIITYMKYSQSPQLTAKELHIHVNTLYQRLRKVEELLHIDLRNPEDLLKLQLACHLRQEG
ncbi:helix-turn-helix domain-containing protein [Brevibacillus formosus]|uniref:helix-turn-helix domain-containing protein n=1 Tax=Brevibacillus TaxID=55080 RepID=UPI000D0E73C6|nr:MULTISPECIES: helix-turn-helix domain-containing protein [Brevibacillus]MBG9945451.1 transcriptional regulator [Brevibacillus formosus]MED1943822.1 helix-turn-helix domain-containing protein [Brevibacillus formosus]MED1999806.1 helix-turn-helix domain-containing protein [Brevibacillus formosus]MED2082057.1 helix-turn-helix domain-containing protein [Brevibacillus formosus]PSK19005.1 transcriptional regulator [Brevibacillus sp. NRRL NRS-603]